METVKQYTKQEAFDIVAAHLHKQGERAYAGNTCFYRMDMKDGVLKCAIGALMNEEDNIKIGSSVRNTSGISGLLNSSDDSEFVEFKHLGSGFLRKLQQIHDFHDYWNLDAMNSALNCFANQNELQYEPRLPSASNIPVSA